MSLEILRSTVEKHRETISRLKADSDAVRAAPVSSEIVARRVDAEIAQAKERASGFFSYLDSASGGFTASNFNRHAALDSFAFWAAYDPDGLRDVALASVRGGGLSDEDRSKRLAAAEAALSEVEVDEELTLRDIDAVTGNHEKRRLDARAELLLAPTAELQAAAKAPSMLAKALRKTGRQ